MPLYQFQHPQTNEIKDILLGMNEDKVFTDEDNVEWKRLFTPINLTPNSHKSLNEKDICEGGKYKLHHITPEMARAQGCKDADEYIEVNNEIVKEHKKKVPKTIQKIID